ncbi:MAG: hypothetical protein FD189_1423 [Elusimicrobia bacterium]|nr:MAG: hypothetical protein FD154_1701 [Elusimicrobiota bacterium]KAF0155404.1 MAG: hypothetical protein FD189_1423 [Elusimicrobiota bacterium]
MTLIKKQIPLLICFVVGFLTLSSYYVPHPVSEKYMEGINKWENIVFGFAFLLGLLSLFFSHYNKIRRRVPGWGYSIFVYIGFLMMVVPAFVSWGQQLDGASLTSLGWAYRFVFNALSGTMFSVLAFYIVSTAYRAFRIKSPQAAVLFIAALIMIIGKVPLGQMMWDGALGWTNVLVADIVEWLMSVPVVAGRRGIMMGLAVGAIVTALKIIFGIERQYMGKD